MARRLKGKQFAKHLKLSGSLSISGSDDSPLANSAAVTIDGGINQIGTAITSSKNNYSIKYLIQKYLIFI